ncbi:hypothetical protein BDR05DRAFT_999695 [Suillus weaverae]|nr:hypothetical protein BDR05DRAFT_999695 [Suillus weaverae]
MPFFMARLATLAGDHDFSNTISRLMSVKFAHRRFKLGPSASPELSQMVTMVTSDVQTILEARQGSVQNAQWASPFGLPRPSESPFAIPLGNLAANRSIPSLLFPPQLPEISPYRRHYESRMTSYTSRPRYFEFASVSDIR